MTYYSNDLYGLESGDGEYTYMDVNRRTVLSSYKIQTLPLYFRPVCSS